MEQPKKEINQSSVEFATDMAIERCAQSIRLAIGRSTDCRKKERHESQMCKACYYSNVDGGGRIGGAAITHRPCGICGKDQSYGNTATDVLCRACSLTHQLCKQCGADQELRPRRKVNIP